MQIKTAIAIGTGVVIGTFIGMGVDEDKKIRIINQFKKKLIYAMTGEEWKPKMYVPSKDPHRRTTYSDIYKTKNPENKESNVDDDGYRFIENLLTFDDEIQANDIKNGLKELLNEYGYFTVTDVALSRGKDIDFRWKDYGWTNTMIQDGIIMILSIDKKYVIVLPNPKLLKDKVKI